MFLLLTYLLICYWKYLICVVYSLFVLERRGGGFSLATFGTPRFKLQELSISKFYTRTIVGPVLKSLHVHPEYSPTITVAHLLKPCSRIPCVSFQVNFKAAEISCAVPAHTFKENRMPQHPDCHGSGSLSDDLEFKVCGLGVDGESAARPWVSSWRVVTGSQSAWRCSKAWPGVTGLRFNALNQAPP